MPAVRTPLLGRAQELSEVLGQLRAADGAPVTITGPGGVGKTRLAVEAATVLDVELADGAAFVSVADIREPSLVAEQVGRALDLVFQPAADPTDGVVAALRDRHMLLVIDNFEQVVEASSFVVALTTRCHKLAVLVTSRRRLDILGERVIELGPLALPVGPGAGAASPPEVAEIASVALFCERAAAVSERFEPDPATLDAIGEICRRLDGLPLAIELVAAYTPQLPPQALLSQLDGPGAPGAFEQSGGEADTDGDLGHELRLHRDLAATIRLSYDLLGDESRQLLRRLSVFAGGWSLDALDGVTRDGGHPGLLHDVLSELIDLHLVEPAPSAGGPPRHRLLETIRMFAREQLSLSGEEEVVANRHADFYLDLAVGAARGLESRGARRWLDEIDLELANLRAAIDHMASTGRILDALRAAAGLGRYWLVRGMATEGLRRLDWCLSHCGPSPEVADAEAWAGRLSFELLDEGALEVGDDDPTARIERARGALSASGDDWAYLRATVHLGYALWSRGEADGAAEVASEGLERCGSAATLWWEAELLNQKALIVRGRDREQAALLADRAIESARAAGHERALADATFIRLLLDTDRGVASTRAFEALYEQCGQIGHRRVQALAALNVGGIAAYHRDPAAGRWYLRAIDVGQETGYYRATWWAMSGLFIPAARTAPAAAARLHGSLLARSEELHPMMTPVHRAAYDRAVASLLDALGAEEFARLVEEGDRLSSDDAVQVARRLASDMAAEAGPESAGPAARAKPGRKRGPRANPELTARELEILAQLVEGRTNQHIADELNLSPKTVMHHTTSVYRKLAVRGRAEAVAHALRSGLVAG